MGTTVDIQSVFFQSWEGLARTAIVGLIGYVILILFLRISGKRTLSTMNAFDWLVTIALGSTFASMLLNKSIALAEGVLALGLLIFLQYIVAWLCTRSKVFQSLVKSEPSLLLHDGQLLHGALRTARVTEQEIRAAVRSAGVAGFDDVRAVVLETNGSFSIVQTGDTSKMNIQIP